MSNKPNLNGAGNFKQGYYTPYHPEKYVGDCKDIKYRSGWERSVMVYLDNSSIVQRWASEPIAIKYISPIDGKEHRYYIDFWFERVDGQKFLLEIKPYKQTIRPVLEENSRSRKKIEYFNYSARNYIINTAKWNAANEFAKANGVRFLIVTEKNLKM